MSCRTEFDIILFYSNLYSMKFYEETLPVFAALGILAGAACSDDDLTTPPAAPEISVGVSTVIPATGGAASIDYRIVNPAEGGGERLK